jgi:acyl carrier protein
MGHTDTFLKVKAIIVDKLDVDENEVTIEAIPEFDLGADSLDTVELIMEFEREFNIIIPDQYVEKLKSVKNCVSYIDNYIEDNKNNDTREIKNALNKRHFQLES